MIDHEKLRRHFLRLQLQSELLFNGGKDVGKLLGRSTSGSKPQLQFVGAGKTGPVDNWLSQRAR